VGESAQPVRRRRGNAPQNLSGNRTTWNQQLWSIHDRGGGPV